MKYKLRANFTKDPETALEEILKNRGVNDIENFMYPTAQCELNAYDLDNIKNAADMLLTHLRKDSNILFIVDCDQDGVSSSAILWLYIKRIFPQARLSFTMHEHKQHGLDDKIDWIEQQDFNLAIVPDAGSYDVEEHQRLNSLGIDCIVLDHHDQLYDENGNPITSAASRTIVVNNQLSARYTNKTLCGAGVVYKFCEVLDDILGIHQAQEFLDLAALGEIADVMDRTNTETNYIITEGLQCIENKGFRTLIEAQAFSLKEKAIWPYKNLNAIDIAFYIAPLINALMRVGTMQEKETMFYCFIDPDKPVPSTKRGARQGDLETAAGQTARVGANAKARQNKLKEKAIDLVDFKIQKEDLLRNNIIVVEIEPSDNIPQELGGLVAMAIVSKYHRPCLIARRSSKNELQGSLRSDGNFSALPSLKKYLEESNFFNYVAGHDNAAGYGIDANKLDKFLEYSNKNLPPDAFENCYTVDYALDARKDNVDLLTSLASHPEFFGNHIDEVKLIIENISLVNIMAMGTNKDSMKISFNGVDYIRFKDLEFVEQVVKNRLKLLTVYGRANLNTFAGRTTIQIFIDDYDFEEDNSKYEF